MFTFNIASFIRATHYLPLSLFKILCKGNLVHSGVTKETLPVALYTPSPSYSSPTDSPSSDLSSTYSSPIQSSPTYLSPTNSSSTNSPATYPPTTNPPTTYPSTDLPFTPVWAKPLPTHPFLNIPNPTVEEFEIKFNVTQQMVPSCRILVYYIRSDKETVADSMVLDVEDKLENQVNVLTVFIQAIFFA